MHILQKQILDALRKAPELHYSQLQPRDIESSHFTYHLTQLITAGLVEQLSRGVYRLSLKGVASVDRLSEGRVNPHLSPKVISYTLLQDSAQYYLQPKAKDPYRGLLNMIGGKVHLREANLQAASRELTEKVRQPVGQLTYCGVATVRNNQDSLLVSHVIAHVFCADILDDTDITAARLIAVSKADLSNFANLAPDLPPIVHAIETEKHPFVIELDLNL